MSDLHTLGAIELAALIKDGTVSSVDVTRACLSRIDARDGEVQAFQHLDPDHALAQAEQRDQHRAAGRPLGKLHGVPVALKDIIDTADYPTENGLAADQGRKAGRDAMIAARIRGEGAVIIGKTVTTEAAYYNPSKTRNPNNTDHTPGGSSSGSAAAVADFMVPLAVGSQTNGSVIRPASFCGVVGFKPGFGQIPRTGMLELSPSLDQMGVFARSVDDAALLADVMAGADGTDDSVPISAPPHFGAIGETDPPVRPALAFIPAPDWADKAEADARLGFEELVKAIPGETDQVPLPLIYRECLSMHRVIMSTEMGRHLSRYLGEDQPISDALRTILEEGKTYSAHDYLAALDWQSVFLSGLDEIFERYDALITPAAYGTAPFGLSSTGDAGACTLWTYCGLPAITLPLLVGDNDLPIGVQLIGSKGEDGRLLRTANWLVRELAAGDDDE